MAATLGRQEYSNAVAQAAIVVAKVAQLRTQYILCSSVGFSISESCVMDQTLAGRTPAKVVVAAQTSDELCCLRNIEGT